MVEGGEKQIGDCQPNISPKGVGWGAKGVGWGALPRNGQCASAPLLQPGRLMVCT